MKVSDLKSLIISGSFKNTSVKHQNSPVFAGCDTVDFKNNSFQRDKSGNIDYNNLVMNKILSFKGTVGIKVRELKYPQDSEYRKALAQKVGCTTEDLGVVIGPQELKDILCGLEFENFSVGKNFENTKNGTFKANLHMHTLDSDGNMTVEQLLDQAVNYANSLKNPPFVFAITNHDTMRDARKAIEIIAKDPQRFKNVRFVPGIEFSSRFDDLAFFCKPIQIEVLGYCIDPFDPKLENFLTQNARENFDYAQHIIDKVNRYGFNASLEEAKRYHNLVKIGASPAFIPLLKEYLIEKAHQKGINPEPINRIFKQYCQQYGTENINPTTPTVEKLAELVKDGMLGLAHPGRISLYSLKHGIPGEKAIDRLIDGVKKSGCEAAEINYQYPDNYHNPGADAWLQHIRQYAEKTGIIKTGGIDNHSKSIFICKM